MTNHGFLGIWRDIAAAAATDYLHWLTREHAQERLGVDGFAAVRVYRLLRDDVRRYFICYELRNADVLTSAAYLARLNDPTPWSQRIMPSLGNFARGGGTVRTRAGSGQGGFLAIVKFDDAVPAGGAALADAATGMDEVTAARFLETDDAQTSVRTNEKGLRKGDQSFAGLLLVEGMQPTTLVSAIDRLGHKLHDGVYTEIFELVGDR